jgi:hypothetical protein
VAVGTIDRRRNNVRGCTKFPSQRVASIYNQTHVNSVISTTPSHPAKTFCQGPPLAGLMESAGSTGSGARFGHKSRFFFWFQMLFLGASYRRSVVVRLVSNMSLSVREWHFANVTLSASLVQSQSQPPINLCQKWHRRILDITSKITCCFKAIGCLLHATVMVLLSPQYLTVSFGELSIN